MDEIAIRRKIEIYKENTRDFKDQRKKVAYAVFSYFTKDFIEFRKSFTSKPYTSIEEFEKIAPYKIIVRI